MSDQPFSPFAPVPPPTFPNEPSPTERPKKGRGGKRRQKVKPPKKRAAPIHPDPDTAAVLDTSLKAPRKRAARKTRPATIPIGILPALAGLKETEAAELMRLVTELQVWAKKPRLKIVAALGKVFA